MSLGLDDSIVSGMLSLGLTYHVSDETGPVTVSETAVTKERQNAIIVRIANALAFISFPPSDYRYRVSCSGEDTT
jgi:hypothetical protein